MVWMTALAEGNGIDSLCESVVIKRVQPKIQLGARLGGLLQREQGHVLVVLIHSIAQAGSMTKRSLLDVV